MLDFLHMQQWNWKYLSSGIKGAVQYFGLVGEKMENMMQGI